MPLLLSPSETDYIKKGVECAIRADGRGRLDQRQASIETGLINQASGSCWVRLQGATTVLVGVRMEIGSMVKRHGSGEGGEDYDGEDQEGSGGGGGGIAGDIDNDNNGMDIDSTDSKLLDKGRVVCSVEW